MASDMDPKSQANATSESRSVREKLDGLCSHDHDYDSHKSRHHNNSHEENISIPSNSKHAEQAIAPFLAKHIPTQYNPVGHLVPQSNTDSNHDHHHHQDASSTKFCYRHRPDLKCRRQANEPSMEQLQNELGTVSQSDQQAISHVWSLFSAAPSKHRNLMLQGILSQCCFPQLSYISASVRDLIKIDFLSALPPELGFRILCFLDTTSLCKAAQVSRRWRSLADDDVVWHRMCEQHIDRKCTKCGWGLPLLERKRLRIEKRQIQLRAISRGNNEWSPAITPLVEDSVSVASTATAPTNHALAIVGEKRKLEDEPSSPQKKLCTPAAGEDEVNSYFQPQTRRPWKDVYKDRFKVGTNWKYGRCSTKIFRGHKNGVMCLQFDENVLITGSYDCTVKVWDIKTGKELRTLEGHTSGIRTLQFDDQKLITGSMDNTTKVWDWRTGKCLRTFQAHTGGVICVNFDAGYIASGSMDHTIRIYEVKSRASYLLKGHTDWVNAVKLDVESRTLLSASDDCTVRLWDLDTRRCIKVFEGHVGQVQQLVALPPEFELDEADLLSGENEDDTSSTSSGPSLAHKHSHHPATAFNETVAAFWPDEPERPAPPRYMLTGALDSTIRLWDVHAPAVSPAIDAANPVQKPPTTNACLRTYFGHVEGIWALAADHLRMVSGSEDRTVKIWDPRSGKCERTWTGHAGPVTCIGLSDSRLVSGSEDCEVRMLLFNTGEGSEGCEEQ